MCRALCMVTLRSCSEHYTCNEGRTHQVLSLRHYDKHHIIHCIAPICLATQHKSTLEENSKKCLTLFSIPRENLKHQNSKYSFWRNFGEMVRVLFIHFLSESWCVCGRVAPTFPLLACSPLLLETHIINSAVWLLSIS